MTDERPKWFQREMKDATLRQMLDALSESESRSVEEVAASVGQVYRSVYAKLARMYSMGLVAREALLLHDQSGGRKYLYRKLPEDVEGSPLYDPAPGWDTLALARCFDLYTYRKRAILHPAP